MVAMTKGKAREREVQDLLRPLVGKPSDDALSALRAAGVSITEAFQFAFQACPPEHQENLLRAILGLPHPPLGKPQRKRVLEADRLNFLMVLNNLVFLLNAGKRAEEARCLMEPYAEFTAQNPYLAHNHACSLAALDRRAEALAQVRIAVESGYPLTEQMERDADLAVLFPDPAFARIFADWRAGGFIQGGYHVDWASVEGHWPPAIPIPALLREFGRWLRRQPHGSIGNFRMENPHPYFAEMNRPLRPYFGEFLSVIDGTQVALWQFADSAVAPVPVVMLCDTGELEQVAESLEEFLIQWSLGESGIYDLKVKAGEKTNRLQAWLGDQKVIAPAPSAHPDFADWVAPRVERAR